MKASSLWWTFLIPSSLVTSYSSSSPRRDIKISRDDVSRVGISRRTTFAVLPILPFLATVSTANALDMDAFMKAELDKNVKKDLTEDEALCRFGQPSKATGEACVRAKMSPIRPNGVDAFGNIDRGDFVRCKTIYVDGGSKYIKTRQCTDGRVEEL